MNLQLFVQDKLLASLPINDSSMTDPFYLPLKKELEEQYKQLIEESNSEPVFCIEFQNL